MRSMVEGGAPRAGQAAIANFPFRRVLLPPSVGFAATFPRKREKGTWGPVVPQGNSDRVRARPLEIVR